MTNFKERRIISQFDSLCIQIAKTKGLIIDIRNNAVGNSKIDYHILESLTKHVTYPNGKEFVGIGIIPDIVVKKTIKDLRSGTDMAKEIALQLLNK